MADSHGLYQRTVIEHNRSPRNFRRLCGCSAEARGHSPLCGDDLTIQVRLDGSCIAEAAFQGDACAVATASASLLTEAVRDLPVETALQLINTICALVDNPELVAELDAADSELRVLAALHDYPTRHACARLPWLALDTALRASLGCAAATLPGADAGLEITLASSTNAEDPAS